MRPVDPRLFRVLPEARGPVAAIGTTVAAQGICAIMQAFAIAGAVVAVTEGADLTGPLAWLAAALAGRAALAAVLERLAGRAAIRISTGLRARLVTDRLARPAGEQRDAASTLTLTTQGVTAVEPYAARFLPALLAAGLVPLLSVATLLVVDAWSALVVALTLPLLPVFAALIGRTTAAATRSRWRALAGLSGHFLDVMRGLPTLVSYGRARRQAGTVADVSDRHRVATMATLRLAFLSSAALELLSTICVAIVAVTVGIRLAGGSMDLATGLVAILLAPEAYWPIRRVGAEYHAAADGVSALGQALDQLDRPPDAAAPEGPATARCPEPTTAPGPPGAVLGQLSDVGYRHPEGAAPVLAGLTTTLRPGLTVVTGPSGAGKTTLLELLAGLRRPASGTCRTVPAHLVAQTPYLLPLSLADNLRLGNGADHGRLWAALRAVGLDGFVASLPDGIETCLGEDGVGLSAGQRARVALARALLSPARLVLLDEPTAHLDPEAAAAVHEVVVQLAADRAVVAATHRPELVALADARIDLPLVAPGVRGVRGGPGTLVAPVSEARR